MPIALPNLDDLTYESLREESLKLIPGLCPEWTDHNLTDPGIILIELFSWLTEMLLYQVDQVPDENYKVFLKLINGENWKLSDRSLNIAIRETITSLRERYRAVTCEDWEYLILNKWPQTPVWEFFTLSLGFNMDYIKNKLKEINIDPNTVVSRLDDIQINSIQTFIDSEDEKCVKRISDGKNEIEASQLVNALGINSIVNRVCCLPRRDLTETTIRGESANAPGHISLVLVPNPSDALRIVLWKWLDPRRILTTRHHIVSPEYVNIIINATLHPKHDALADDVHKKIEQVFPAFFDAISGGPMATGWPFGRDLYVSEVYKLLDSVDGVDFVEDVDLIPSEKGRSFFGDNKHLIGIRLYENELVKIDIDESSFKIIEED
ncbi:MAG: hypothetical protein JEZ06_08050 [Anaerolineaceae bacterium]|nr:hypothetical protein [Anaerolineaceae bacterium]